MYNANYVYTINFSENGGSYINRCQNFLFTHRCHLICINHTKGEAAD